MPSKTERQRRYMAADLARARKGLKTKTGMSVKQLREFASKPLAGHRKRVIRADRKRLPRMR